jgi:uncharacterized damage-inducible protein DinB
MHPDISEPASSVVAPTGHGSFSAQRALRKVQCAFERLERQKRNLLAEVATWTEGERRFRPGPQSWSALDVIDHLVRVECESLTHIQARLSERRPVTIRERIVARIVFAVMLSPLKIKVPAGVPSVLPGGSPEEDAILIRWHDVRKNMKVLSDGLLPNQLTCALFHHPVSGSMRMLDALTFLSVHLTHHRYQLRRICGALSRR